MKRGEFLKLEIPKSTTSPVLERTMSSPKLDRRLSSTKLSPRLQRTLSSPKLSPKMERKYSSNKLRRAPIKLKLDLQSKLDQPEYDTSIDLKQKFKPSLDLTSFKSRRYSEELEQEQADKLFEKLKNLAPEGDVYEKYMKIEKKLASGMYGVVGFYYKKNSSTDKMYIVKAISYKRNNDISYDLPSIKKEVYGKLINEILSLKEVQENNCKETNLSDLCFIEAFRDDENIYIVTRFKNDTMSLQKYIEDHTFTTKQIATYILILLNKLKIIHSLNIVHNDIKPGNILVQYDKNGIIDLSYIDYGESCLCNNSDICMTSGSVFYHPESVLYITKQKCNLTYYSDIYSIGVIAKELLNKSKIKNNMLDIFISKNMLNEDMYDVEYTIEYLDNLTNKFVLILNKIINESEKSDTTTTTTMTTTTS